MLCSLPGYVGSEVYAPVTGGIIKPTNNAVHLGQSRPSTQVVWRVKHDTQKRLPAHIGDIERTAILKVIHPQEEPELQNGVFCQLPKILDDETRGTYPFRE